MSEDEMSSGEIVEIAYNSEDENENVVLDIASPTTPEKPKVGIGRVVFSVSFYVCVSLSTVFSSKFIFSYSTHKFNYPLVLTTFQVFCAIIFCLILFPLNQVSPQFQSIIKLPPLSFEKKKAIEAFKPCIIFALMISFNNYCLSFVDVTLYLVFRSLTVLFAVLLTYIFLQQSTKRYTLISICVVSSGYILGSIGGFSNQSYTFSVIILGLVCGTLSSFFVALNSIFVKNVIKNTFKGDFFEFMFYQNVIGFFLFLGLSLITGEFFRASDFEYFFYFDFIFMMLFSACTGFLINIAYNLLIDATTPLTKETVATAKACLQPLIGALVFGDQLNVLTGIGAAVCIFGSFLYSIFKFYDL